MLNIWLKLALAFRGIRQVELARELTERVGRSVDASAVHKMLRGTRRMFADEMLQISQICRYPVPITYDGILASEKELQELDRKYRERNEPGPSPRDERLEGAPGRFEPAMIIRTDDLKRAFTYELLRLENVELNSTQINSAAECFIRACSDLQSR